MTVMFTPTSSFLYRADADRALDLLKSDGIHSMVRAANDPPEGYRVVEPQVGFTLWVSHSDEYMANDILRRAALAPLLCEQCGTEHATEHVTLIRNGERRQNISAATATLRSPEKVRRMEDDDG